MRQKQQREDAVGEQPRRGLPALAMDMGIGRDEGGVESAFGKDRTKMVGQPQRTKNASATGPAPRIAASMMSRAKPVNRESSV